MPIHEREELRRDEKGKVKYCLTLKKEGVCFFECLAMAVAACFEPSIRP